MTHTSSRITSNSWGRVFLAALLVQVLVLYWPWTVPQPPGPLIGWDKIVHFAIFAAAAHAGIRAGYRAPLVVTLLLLHAPLSEWIQATFLPRYADVGDALADVIGTLVGAGTAWWATRRHSPPGARPST